MESISAGPLHIPSVVASSLQYIGDSEILLVYNLAPESADVDLSGVTVGEKSGSDLEIGGVLLTDAKEAAFSDGTLTMPGYSVVIVK